MQRLSNDANVELKKPDLSGTHHVHADAVLAKAGEGLGFGSWPSRHPRASAGRHRSHQPDHREVRGRNHGFDHCPRRYSAPPTDDGRIARYAASSLTNRPTFAGFWRRSHSGRRAVVLARSPCALQKASASRSHQLLRTSTVCSARWRTTAAATSCAAASALSIPGPLRKAGMALLSAFDQLRKSPPNDQCIDDLGEIMILIASSLAQAVDAHGSRLH